eukprot:TRINITY_DN54866_c0_g1_i1.p1 TRINITY_DN54866_c0_g1~~TRINITY_DN54866_c0_g1_i1.p1  ORF type:complete len:326 (+),score=63.71 TRINITY_DN54866_c0_g1_i1:98-1075(+)
MEDVSIDVSAAPSVDLVTSPNVDLAANGFQRLSIFESRLDALQADAAAAGKVATDFAAETSERISVLEADLRRLTCTSIADACREEKAAAEVAGARCQDLLVDAGRGLLDDVRGCVRRLLTAASDQISTALEAERVEVLAVAETASRTSLVELAARWREEAATQATDLEARISERVSQQCATLIDAAWLGLGAGGVVGLDSLLRDLVESVESVSARVAALEVDCPPAAFAAAPLWHDAADVGHHQAFSASGRPTQHSSMQPRMAPATTHSGLAAVTAATDMPSIAAAAMTSAEPSRSLPAAAVLASSSRGYPERRAAVAGATITG